jgi:hypothetical protein
VAHYIRALVTVECTPSDYQPSSKREPAFGPPFGRANLYGEAGLQAWLAYLRPDTRLPHLDFALTPIRGGLLALLPQAMLHLQHFGRKSA